MEAIDFDVSGGDPTRDIPNVRVIPLDNGNKVYFKRKDPYGYWYMNYDKGKMPEQLSGAYTTFAKAKDALDNYLKDDRWRQPKEEIVKK